MVDRSIRSFKKKGRSSRALQFTNKLTSEELKVTGTRPLLANDASFMKMNVICLMQLGEYPVVTKSYDPIMNSSRAIQLPTFHKIILWKITENTEKSKGQQ